MTLSANAMELLLAGSSAAGHSSLVTWSGQRQRAVPQQLDPKSFSCAYCPKSFGHLVAKSAHEQLHLRPKAWSGKNG